MYINLYIIVIYIFISTEEVVLVRCKYIDCNMIIIRTVFSAILYYYATFTNLGIFMARL